MLIGIGWLYMNKYLLICSLFYLFGCFKDDASSTKEALTKIKNQSSLDIQKKITKMQNEVKFRAGPKDISPEGFNWVHYDLAKIYSRAIYEHNFKGVFRGDVLKRRLPLLNKYLASLSAVKLKDFNKWNITHKKSFMINLYHASLIKYLIANDFKELEIKDYQTLKLINVFNNVFTIKDFISKELSVRFKDFRLIYALKCFEKGCPEIRNTIYNFKNIDALLETSKNRYLSDPSKSEFKTKLTTLQSYFIPGLVPSKEELLKKIK